jgi:glycosyltransferase involved in cell wall biosynthesis
MLVGTQHVRGCGGYDMTRSLRPLRVLFLYNLIWDKEIADYYAGRVPAHRLFGYADLAACGVVVEHVQVPLRWRRFLGWSVGFKLYQGLYAMLRSYRCDAIVATHEASALGVLALRCLGLGRAPVLVVNVGLLRPANTGGWRRRCWAVLLRRARLVLSYGSAQCPLVARVFHLAPDACCFLPFGVDTHFFSPHRDRVGAGTGVIAVGTNEGKDYPTLVRAIAGLEVALAIVTDAWNVATIRDAPGIRVSHDIPIRQLRQMYQAHACCVIPLHAMDYSSGQTVMLENMALAKPVIVSSTPGTRDYITAGETGLLVPPGDVAALRQAIRWVLTQPDAAEAMGQRARARVVAHFSSAVFGVRLAAIIRQVVAGRRKITLPC